MYDKTAMLFNVHLHDSKPRIKL